MMKLGQVGRTIHLGYVGLGNRGFSTAKMFAEMPDVKIVAVCDVYPDRVERAQKAIREMQQTEAFGTTDYHALLAREDVEAVVVDTDWTTHIKIAIDAMKAGKRVAMEVGGASSIEECWDLVHTSEQTGIPCMMLENCCYGKEEMTLLNMIAQGLFGELVHCQGGYEHDLRDEVGNGDINRHYRQENFEHRNGELYPTHELGPIAKYLKVNRGNRMLTLTSMASKAAGLNVWLKQNRPNDEVTRRKFNEGDIVTTMIKCANGETIVLTHDCTLPRPYSRGGRVQGTRGIWMEDNRSIYIDGVSPVDPSYWTHRWEKDEKYMSEYMHPLWKAYENFGLRGGHDGMDYLVQRAFIESVQNGTEPPINVYDVASWMAVTCLSEASIAQGSAPVEIPDFTNGRWIHPQPARDHMYTLDMIPTDKD